jgi:hypothetical protein
MTNKTLYFGTKSKQTLYSIGEPNTQYMKNMTLLISAMFFSSLAFSQDILMGPKAKNLEPGKLRGPQIALVHQSAPLTLQGPEAKNSSAMFGKSAGKLKVGFRDTKDIPKGLAAKNSNPWDRKTTVSSKAAFEEDKTMKRRKYWWH